LGLDFNEIEINGMGGQFLIFLSVFQFLRTILKQGFVGFLLGKIYSFGP
jgi:hypothetical protein